MRDKPQRAPSGSRARQNWLTGHGRSNGRRISRIPFTAKRASHVGERSATRHRSKRSTQGHRRSERNHRNRWSERNDRNGRSGGNHRNGPRQSHRNPSHVSDWGGCRSARGRCRSCSNFACRRGEAFVAAGWQRRGRSVRAQCHCDPAQSSPSSNYSDVESIKDRHRHRLLHSRPDIPHSSNAAEPQVVPKSRLDDCVNYRQPNRPTHHAAPHRFQMVTFGMVRCRSGTLP
ncbi:hypothetical protein C8E89_1052 [Mycolicibacterium moriokaense]|uniref:Uncharacterized protein n=1 Tax=Mycolicibacterium moriokaense TaxID=39691 RepID=A0A318HLR6_9MYCO|nr:hypothetical protein C8E89_1052 [Mycolicibacterium moriokaense]